jgi:hypothetical protein
MNRTSLLLIMSFVILFTACSQVPVFTPISQTASVSTAYVSTVVPSIITPFPPDYTPPPTAVPPSPTPIPTLSQGFSPTELKYRLLEEFPNFFFCDPDYYPIAREDETTLALQHFPEIQANPEEFDVILSHNNVPVSSSYTDTQKLLIYQEHKKLAAIHLELVDSLYRFQLKSLETQEAGELITGTIDGQGNISVEQRTPSIATCPICLAHGTLIDTPSGRIPIQDLRLGMLVWTVDRAGLRVAKPVLMIGKTVVPITHKVVHLILDDGRQLWVSPGHPAADGRPVGWLHVGDSLDGATVASTELVSYSSDATYDLLPAGDTHFYWADGILLASTLTDNSR